MVVASLVADQQTRIERNVAASGLVALQIRLGALCLTALTIPTLSAGRVVVGAALGLATVVSIVLLARWETLGQRVLGHPLYLATEIFLVGMVLSIAGPESPFVYYSLFTALFGGLFYRRAGAVGLAGALVVGYLAAVQIYSGGLFAGDGARAATDAAGTLHDLVVLPALIPLAAAAGVVIRGLLEHQATTDHRLSLVASEAAAERERNRLARDLHDSFAKTLQGIAMSAEALAVTTERRPERAPDLARTLADGARTASTEARSILIDLRSTVDINSPLHLGLAREVAAWSERCPDIDATTNLEPIPVLDPLVVQELLLVIREALRNVSRHAQADLVEVSLSANDTQVAVSVRDNGTGFHFTDGATEQQFVGHFGLVGMRERMETIGGQLHIRSEPGIGTTLTCVVGLQSLHHDLAATVRRADVGAPSTP